MKNFLWLILVLGFAGPALAQHVDIPGNPGAAAITGGTINGVTLGSGVVAGSASVTATGGSAAQTEAGRAGANLTVEDFGAKGDCSTDDSAAFNAYAAYVRASTGYQAIRAINFAHSACYRVLSSINFTALRPYPVTVFGNGSVIVGNVGATHAIISAMASNIKFQDLRIITQGTVLYGIQVGNVDSTGAADLPMELDNVYFNGNFANAAFLNRGAEGSSCKHTLFTTQTAGSYAVIMDGATHWPIDTTYIADSFAPGTQISFNENKFDDCKFVNQSTTAGSSDIWMSNFGRHHYSNSYTEVSSASPAVVIYSAFANSTDMLDWDVHSEVGPSSEFFITGPYATPTIFGLHYRNHLDQTEANASVFKLDTMITSVALPGLDVQVGAIYNTGVTMFDQPAKYSGSASVVVPAGSYWNAAAGTFTGCTTIGSSRACNGGTLDGVTIGATTPRAIRATTGNFSGTITGAANANFGNGTFGGGSDANGQAYIGLVGSSGTPYLDFNGNSVAGAVSVRLIANAAGQLSLGSGAGTPTFTVPSGIVEAASLVSRGSVISSYRGITGTLTADAALASDYTIPWFSTAASAKTETIPACGGSNYGQIYVIKDSQGTAATYPITVTPASGSIDGAANYVINTNHGAVTLQCLGATLWAVLASR